jgi:RNA polymerase sigma-70 factor, ECF subfamily
MVFPAVSENPFRSPRGSYVFDSGRTQSSSTFIVQQTMFKAFTHLGQFRFEACFRTWLIRIALNEVAQIWRRRVSGRCIGLEDSTEAISQAADPRASPFHSYERGQTAKFVNHAISSLPESHRVVVRMRDLEERSICEVAEALCLTIAAVKSRHHRGRLRMPKFLSASTAAVRNQAAKCDGTPRAVGER